MGDKHESQVAKEANAPIEAKATKDASTIRVNNNIKIYQCIKINFLGLPVNALNAQKLRRKLITTTLFCFEFTVLNKKFTFYNIFALKFDFQRLFFVDF